MRLAGVERPLGRLAGLGGRVEVRLADLEMDDVAALRLEGSRPGGDLERGLGADVAHPFGDAHLRLRPRWGRPARPGPMVRAVYRRFRTTGRRRLADRDRARIAAMTRFFDLDEANAAIPEVRTILESLRDQRAELIRLRDEVLAHGSEEARSDAPAEANAGRRGGRSGEGPADDAAANPIDTDIRVLRLRMQGVIDRMQAGVVRIDELGITLREIESGLIDFPALATGRQYWIWWRPGSG